MGVGVIFSQYFHNNCRLKRGIEVRQFGNGMATSKEIVSQTETYFQPCPATCVQVPSLYRHGNKYNRPVSRTIAVANNQIRALSADHPPHSRLSFDPLACSLTRSLVSQQTLLIAHPLCLNRPELCLHYPTPPIHPFLLHSVFLQLTVSLSVSPFLRFLLLSSLIRILFRWFISNWHFSTAIILRKSLFCESRYILRFIEFLRDTFRNIISALVALYTWN